MSKKTILALLAALALAAPAIPALAHGDQDHDKEHAEHKDSSDADHGPKHGGQFIETDDHHGVEMVTTDTSIVFHVTEHHEPLDLTGTSFKAVIQTDAGTNLLTLTPESNTLRGTLTAALLKGTKVVLTGKDGHGDAIQARFVKQ